MLHVLTPNPSTAIFTTRHEIIGSRRAVHHRVVQRLLARGTSAWRRAARAWVRMGPCSGLIECLLGSRCRASSPRMAEIGETGVAFDAVARVTRNAHGTAGVFTYQATYGYNNGRRSGAASILQASPEALVTRHRSRHATTCCLSFCRSSRSSPAPRSRGRSAAAACVTFEIESHDWLLFGPPC